MEAVPHIDITDPARIQALLDDRRNFSWRAVDSETLDTWSPDLGLTAYPQPSVYRAGAVASSGISSTLRQRFWQTVEGQADHTGMRYIGIVIYLAAGESAPMELRLASQEIGRVEPGKGDNRLHLIVVDKAVEFIGEMEIFQLTAPGPGAYRIEQFVLLHERPEANRVPPELQDITIRKSHWKDNCYIHFHILTSRVCSITVNFQVGFDCPEYDYDFDEISGPSRLHDISTEIGVDWRIIATITARDESGACASRIVEFSTTKPESPDTDEVIVQVELINLTAAEFTGLPLQFGIPLGQGALYETTSCFIQAGSLRIPALAREWKCRPDGSVRWIMFDSRVPASLAETGRLHATVHINGDNIARELRQNQGWLTAYELTNTRRVSLRENQGQDAEREHDIRRIYLAKSDSGSALSVMTNSASEFAREIEERRQSLLNSGISSSSVEELVARWYPSHIDGVQLPLMSLSDWRFEAVLGHGLALESNFIMEPQSYGGDSATFKVLHQDEHGVAHLQSILRLQFYPDQPFFKLYHRLEVISPALAPAAAGGDLPAECSDAMRENIVGVSGEESTLLKLRSFSLRLPFEGAHVVQHRDETWQLGGSDWQLRHDHDLAHEIKGDIREDRAPGHIIVDGDSGLLGIGVRNFWQTYPKAITVGSGGIDISLFPERAGRDLPGDEDAWHRLYFWLDEDGYKLKAGMALSSEILIDFGGDNPAAFDWLENPVLVRPDIDYLNSTGALNPIGARQDSPLPDYDALTDRAIDSFYKDREHFRAYGQVNFGDWYGESAWSWGNNEYDPSYCAYTEFLRGGDSRWARLGAEAARHLADIDTVNFSSDASEIGGQSMHMPGHLGGYLPPYFRSKMGGTKSIPSHTWVEGPLLHFLLTGDQAVYDSLLKTKDWLLQRRFFDYYDFSNAREAGWHLIHLCALADSLDDADCLNAASIIVERVLERQEAEGGWVRNLGEPHCGCGYPRCRGEAGFMVGVLLSGLKRYHHLTGEDAVAGAIIGGARWLIRETFDEASGHFRYTSCPKRTLGGTYQHTQYVLEALASAWELSGDPEIGAYLRDGLPTIGMFPGDLDHLGLGKALSQQMRYVPTIIAALERRSLESVEATND